MDETEKPNRELLDSWLGRHYFARPAACIASAIAAALAASFLVQGNILPFLLSGAVFWACCRARKHSAKVMRAAQRPVADHPGQNLA